jgi:hypothetical protein
MKIEQPAEGILSAAGFPFSMGLLSISPHLLLNITVII